MTEAERRTALEAIATEVRACTACRLHVGRTQAVPGEGHPSTEVLFVGEGPGYNEDRRDAELAVHPIRVAHEVGDEPAARRSYRSLGVPSCSIPPPFITMIRSETASASSWSCVT